MEKDNNEGSKKNKHINTTQYQNYLTEEAIEKDLMKFRNLNSKSLEEIANKLRELGEEAFK